MIADATAADFLARRVGQRIDAADAYFRANATAIAACAAAMADRFFDGATLLVLGTGLHATDAQHNSVEYVHPVLPGCRALPALSLSNDAATVTALLEGADPAEVHARQLRVLGRRGDIALAFCGVPPAPAVRRGLAEARDRDMLTVALVSGGGGDVTGLADHVLHARTEDDLVAQELHLATYHMLWELVHIVLNHRGIPTAIATAARA
ncbi:MAG TPA: phosphoheptose isomerase [Candidatus Dormibacteraeota bacterium]|nr:phosphoheptose isomerase [Candidatus Dormibacteraeota bacterium]